MSDSLESHGLKLKSGCTSKVTTKKTKIQPAAWEKILVNYMANKGLINNF